MKYLLILVVLSAAQAFGQNAYGSDYLNLHCTAPDIGGNASFGDFPRAGLAPSSSVNGTAIIYCDTSAAALKVSFNGGAYTTFGGSGTVSANSGSAGALAFYAAAGGSTTVGPDANLTDASSLLTYTHVFASSPAGGGSCGALTNGLQTGAGSAAVTSLGANELNICAGAGSRTADFLNGMVLYLGSFSFGTNKGQHFNNQAATSDMAGVCSGTTTTCSVTFTTNYTSTPSCVVTPTTTAVTQFAISSQANTGFTVTYAPTGTTNFNYICIGNPN